MGDRTDEIDKFSFKKVGIDYFGNAGQFKEKTETMLNAQKINC